MSRLLDQDALVLAGGQRVVRSERGLGSGKEMGSGGLSPSRDQRPGTSTTACPFTSCEASRVKASSERGGGQGFGSYLSDLEDSRRGGVFLPTVQELRGIIHALESFRDGDIDR